MKTLTKIISDFSEFERVYLEGVDKIPLPFIFYINNKKYELIRLNTDSADLFDFEANKQIKLNKNMFNKEYKWEIKGIDYFKNYLYYDETIIFNLNNYKIIKIISDSIIADGDDIATITYNKRRIHTKPYLFNEWVLKYIYNKAKTNNGLVLI